MKSNFTLILLLFFMFIGSVHAQTITINGVSKSVVDINPYIGGTCINTGCTSSSAKVLGAYIGLADGTPITDANVGSLPDNTTAYVFIDVLKTGNKFDLYVQFNLVNLSDGGVTKFVQAFAPGDLQTAYFKLINEPITGYITGGKVNSVYGLEDILVSWDNSNDGKPICGERTSDCDNGTPDIVAVGPFKAFYSYTPIKCNGGKTAITFGVSGGTAPYTVGGNTLVKDATTGLYTYTTSANISAGSYTYVASDSNGHTQNLSVTITEPSELILSEESHVNVSCAGGTNGSISLNTPIGGTPPYTYLWNNGATTQNISSLASGTYSVTIKDVNGCTKTLNINVNPGDAVSPTVNVSVPNSTIEGCDTAAIAVAGMLPYSTIETTITDVILNQNGVTFSDGSLISSITYQDSAVSGTCQKTITRTFRVTDVCGHTGFASKTIRIQDTTAPTGIAPAGTTDINACFVNATTVPVGTPAFNPITAAAGYSDNCSGAVTATLTNTVVTGNNCNWTVTYTFKVSDACSNELTGQTISHTGGDKTAPTFTRPADIIVFTKADCSYDVSLAITGDVTNEADNCSTGIQAQFSDAAPVAILGCQGGFSIARTWILSDNCGNSAAPQTQTITVRDNTAPTFTRPANITVFTKADCSYDVSLAVTGDVTNEADNCSPGIQAQFSDAAPVAIPGCQGGFTIARTWTLSDNCGNSATPQIQTITVRDNTAPTFTRPANITVFTKADCSYDVSLAQTGDVTNEADNCSTGIQAQFSDAALVAIPGCQGGFTIARTWTLSDNCGNSAAPQIQTITIRDNTAPTFTRPANITVFTKADCSYDISLAQTGDVTNEADNCSPGIQAQFSDAAPVAIPGCQGGFTIARTWTLSDNCGNSAAPQIQTITVRDNIAPTFTRPADITVFTKSNCTYDISVAITGDVTNEEDNCSPGIQAQFSDAAPVAIPGCQRGFTIARTWTLRDNCGNSAAPQIQTITIRDNTAPTFTRPADITVFTKADCSYDISVAQAGDVTNEADNCSTGIQAQFSDAVPVPLVGCLGGFTITRTWTLSDNCGNSANPQIQTITVRDNTAPNLIIPANVPVQCDSVPAVAPIGTITATDNCDPNPIITYLGEVRTNGNCPNTYTLTRTWQAVDGCGNRTTKSQTITVQDTTAPTFTAPGDVILNLDQNCAVNLDPANAGNVSGVSDNCDASPVVKYEDHDCYGNFNNASISAGQDNYFYFDVNGFPNLTAKDIDKITLDFETNQGKGNVEFTLVSPNGTAIVLVGPYCSGGNCDTVGGAEHYLPVFYPSGYPQWNNNIPISYGSPVNVTPNGNLNSTNNINGVTSYVSSFENLTGPMNGTWLLYGRKVGSQLGTIRFNGVCLKPKNICPSNNVITRTWTVTDACGNKSTASQIIKVQDITGPVITGTPVAVTVSCSSEVPVASIASVTATDNCAGQVTVSVNDVITSGSCPNKYTVTRTWTATDVCGNATTSSQVITVDDQIKPVITGTPVALTVSCSSDVPVASIASVTATDNCVGQITVSVNDVITSGSCPNKYMVTRTWTATDICGNSATSSQEIIIDDQIKPVITGTPVAVTVSCSSDVPVASIASVTATDNCAGQVTVSVNDVITPGSCPNKYLVTRTWTATDICGNSATSSQVITVDDQIKPLITKEATSITIECDGNGNQNAIVAWLNSNGGATATDNCSGAITWTNDFSSIGNDCSSAVEVTFTATDICGNSSSTKATFSVKDTTKPTAPPAPPAVTVSCSSDVPQAISLTATDNCNSAITVLGTDTKGSEVCANKYTITRTWTFVDACSNSTTISQLITVDDQIKPIITGTPAAVTVSCSSGVPVASIASVTATDNCAGEVTVSVNDVVTPGSCPNKYAVTRTWTATDVCGNATTSSQTINVQDTTPPVIDPLPEPSTINCPEVPEFAPANVSDNCDGLVTVSSEDVTTPGACAGSYSVTRTWTAIDACGNTSTASQTINVQDITAPVIAALPGATTIECPATPAFAQATATDECGSAFTLTFADATAPGSCAGSYSVTRTWTATDVCGNKSTALQTINVQDTTPPVIDPLPEPSTINCPAVPEFAPAKVSDNCDGLVTVSSEEVTTPGACAGSYSVTRTWTATDSCGNKTTASQTINVQDITAPVIAALPGATTIECPATPEFAQATATDECGSAFTLTSTDATAPGSCAGSYSVTRTWTATDACGNKSTAAQTINVLDTTPPVIDPLPEPSTINCPAIPEFAAAKVSDNCDGLVTVSSEEVTTPGACAGSYSVTRTWTATDSCGNKTTASQTINVQDITAPVIAALPGATTIECSATPEFAQATATDECGSSFTLTFADATAPGACAGSYSVTRTWTATDACGNKSTASQTINVLDTTPPVIDPLPEPSTINCPAVPEFAPAKVSDNCDGLVTVSSEEVTTPGACAGSYSVTRTWTATDSCGNKTTASQTINVQDITAPVIAALPGTTTIDCSATPEFAQATATDECGSSFTLTFADATAPGSCAGSYSVTRTWTATDACDNKSTASQTINVQDITPPVIAALPQPSTINCPAVPEFAEASVSDNCDGLVTVSSADVTTPGACAGSYSVTRTWTATDACGNKSTASQTINVQDITAPVIAALPGATTIDCSATPEFAQATATDECGSSFTLTFADATAPGACAGSYSVTRTWTATDACGNKSTASQTINVQDITPPVIAALPQPSTINCPAVPEFAEASVSDNCDGLVTVSSADVTTPGACAGTYSVTRTWTATDSCGNKSTASQTINVQDITGPIIATLPGITTINCPATPEFAQATATDECGSSFTLTFADATTQGACAGTYSVTRTWTATDSCGNKSTASQIINVTDITPPQVVTTYDSIVQASCESVPDKPLLQFADDCSNSPITPVYSESTSDIKSDGTYVITRTWTVTDPCGNTKDYTQIVNVSINNYLQFYKLPEAQCNEDIDLTLDLSQIMSVQFPDVVSPNGVYSSTSPGLVDTVNGIFKPFGLSEGDHIVTYSNNDGQCPKSVEFTISVSSSACKVLPVECNQLKVYNALTPNGDGTNEFFEIENITEPCYVDNTVEIYNRWGVKIFEATNYDNATKVFTGVSEGRDTVKKSEELPTGTYFYILKYRPVSEGNYKVKNGYLYLSR